MPYRVMYNQGAGDYYIEEYSRFDPHYRTQAGYYREIYTSYDEEDCKRFVDKQYDRYQVYCVYWNNASWDGYISEESWGSGNYRGSKHHPYSLVGEYKTREEAEKHLNSLRDK